MKIYCKYNQTDNTCIEVIYKSFENFITDFVSALNDTYAPVESFIIKLNYEEEFKILNPRLN